MKILFESENNSLKKTLEKAVEEKKDLRDADLSGAYLRGRGAIVTDEDIKRVKDDLFEVLTVLNGEVPALLESLRAGKINGSCYQGECACLVGTIANIKHCHYEEIPGIKPNSSRPIERFFLSVRPGQTPENSGKCKEIEGWILEYMESKTHENIVL